MKGRQTIDGLKPAERILAALRSLGTDTEGRPISIRRTELAERAKIGQSNMALHIDPLVKSGDVYVCQITPNGTGRPVNEYRLGTGVPQPAWRPLDTKRRGVAVASAHLKAAPTNKPAGSTPAPSSKPQPAVGSPTPAAGDRAPPAGEPAVAAQATPKPKTPARMNAAPAAPKASAGDVFSITIDDTGTLIIATDEGDVIELQPEHTKRLGHFMVGSERVWNPF